LLYLLPFLVRLLAVVAVLLLGRLRVLRGAIASPVMGRVVIRVLGKRRRGCCTGQQNGD
jgi:hypothetical protein